uniref:Putative rna-binding protein musashi/mrna cleavage and polyadenylation factor i complex n=1 Tax=Xenopsylla cheopis TaxID=163159 RepID=A0A6M2DRS8_XENCH
MAANYIPICEDEMAEVIELPLEQDGTLLLSTLTGQFDNALGLKYRHPESKAMRGIRIAEGKLHPPTSDGWVDGTYICVLPKENKRKNEDEAMESSPIKKRAEKRCVDLVVLGLPFAVTDEDLRKYFETFGEVHTASVKKDITGQSKGFGFLRFNSYEVQMKILTQRHKISNRWCEVKIHGPKDADISTRTSKIFVARCTEDITAEDLSSYFSKFGEVINVYIPKPHRGFSFVTFDDPDTAESLYGQDHIIKGVSLFVTNPSPPQKQNNSGKSNINFVSGGMMRPLNRNDRDMMGTINGMNPAVIAAALKRAGFGIIDEASRSRPAVESVPQQQPLQNQGLFQPYRNSYNEQQMMDYDMEYMQQRAPAPPTNPVKWMPVPQTGNRQKPDQTWPSHIYA